MMFRDIHQLRDAPEYGVTAIDGLFAAESALEKAVKFVPYCDKHVDVWSPQFGQIILDCASQIDSIWKAAEQTNNSSASKRNRTIEVHRKQYEAIISSQKVIFFGGPNPAVIEPFDEWNSTPPKSPQWWNAYNDLKHDRFSNQSKATLRHAVDSVGGLFLAILYSGVCDLALISAQTLDTSKSGYNPWADNETRLLRDIPYKCLSLIETRLFAHPLGVFGVSDCNRSNYWDSHSPRFNIWWALNADKYNAKHTSE